VIDPYKSFHSGFSASISRTFHLSDQCLMLCSGVVRNTHVQDAVGCARQYVKIATCHAPKMKDVDGRDKPGHDEETSSATTP
jgi:hypothetical protein